MRAKIDRFVQRQAVGVVDPMHELGLMAHRLRTIDAMLQSRKDIALAKRQRLARIIEYAMFSIALSHEWPEDIGQIHALAEEIETMM